MPQVFVANPNKPKPIVDILLRNRDRLVEFLTRFHTDRQDDEQFNDEKAYLIKQIKEMKAPVTGAGLAIGATSDGDHATFSVHTLHDGKNEIGGSSSNGAR